MNLKHFSIRDLLWLTLAVALVMAWWVDRRKSAAEYLIQVEEVESIFASPKSDEIVKEECIRSVELLCHPGKPATAKATIGKVTFTAKVLVREVANDVLNLSVSYYTSVDTGSTIPDENGIRKPCPAVNSAETQISVRLNERQEFGSGTKTSAYSKVKQAYVLTAKEHKPATK